MYFDQLFQMIENGIRDVYDSSRYRRYLTTMSNFHSYSLNNCLLIFSQMPEATLVAGYHTWRKQFGRHVKHGEHGIRILAPVRTKKEEAEEEQEELHFKSICVFDVSQTEGDPLPTYMDETLDGTVKDYDQFMNELKLISPVPVEETVLSSGIHGCYRPKQEVIQIQKNMPQLQTIKTLVHEIAHASLHNRQNNGEQLSHEQKEIEAESIAYILCRHFGLDTGEYSFGYLAGYSSSRELPELRASMERIHQASDNLINQIETLRHPERMMSRGTHQIEADVEAILEL